ncbi:MAG: YdcF family protein [Propionibacteriaceae bacterium]
MESLLIAAVFLGLYAYYRRRDRRLLRNGVFLLATIWFGVTGVLGIVAAAVPGISWISLLVLALTPLAVIVLAVFLIGNGLTMIRSERRSLGNLMSLIAGIAIFALPVLALVLVLSRNPLAVGAAALLFFLCSYLGVVFGVFLFYSWVYGRTSQEIIPATVVVLGSRLINGEVPPLLRSRLDEALVLYRRGQAAGRPPLLIPSGGHGPDEVRPEGAAMAEYLIDHGADPQDVRPEEQARNTEQNLVLSAAVQDASGREGPVLVVTNNYHVLRTALLARRVGSDAQVVGAPTARYYVPSAFLREFVAVLVEHKRVHLALCLPFVALTTFLVIAIFRQGG